jgi:hypothetical protein
MLAFIKRFCNIERTNSEGEGEGKAFQATSEALSALYRMRKGSSSQNVQEL